MPLMPPTWPEKLRRLGPFGVALAVASTMPPIGSIVLLTNADAVSGWLRGHAAAGVAAYVVGFALLGGAAALPTYAVSALGGWAFGFAGGTAAAMAAITLAAAVGYVVGRLTARERLAAMIEQTPRVRVVYAALLRSSPVKAAWVVTLLRAPPNAPFALSNFLLAGARVGWGPYLIGTAVGMAPRTAAVCWLASTLQGERFAVLDDPWRLTAGLAVTVIVLAFLGLSARRALNRATRGDATAG